MSTFPFTLSDFLGGGASGAALTLDHVTDYLARARARYLEQYKDKANFDALASVFVAKLQEIEDAFWQLYEERTLDSAVGVQLDVLGRILNIARGPYGDEDYRAILRAQVKLLKSSGTINQLIEIVGLASQGADVSVIESFPAALTVQVSGVTTSDAFASLLARFVRAGRAGAVYGLLEYHPQALENTAIFDSTDPDQVFDAGLFGSAIVG